MHEVYGQETQNNMVIIINFNKYLTVFKYKHLFQNTTYYRRYIMDQYVDIYTQSFWFLG